MNRQLLRSGKSMTAATSIAVRSRCTAADRLRADTGPQQV